ncbi:MAG: asparaginase [Chloroflexota bacterium]|nr:asparaginase [Chloroflexota bacterium]
MNDNAIFPRSLPRICVMATGGTIAMRTEQRAGGPVPALKGRDLVAAAPGLDRVAQVRVEDFANIPSERMRPEHWCGLAQRVSAVLAEEQPDGIVILHGTDTMEETAFFLDITVPSPISIVFTGAMRAATDPDPDGPANILQAAAVAVDSGSRDRGVLIVMHGEIHSARRGTKIDTSDVDAFESVLEPDLGIVGDGLVQFSHIWTPHVHVPLPSSLPRVDIIPMYAGVDEFALRAALDRGAAGLVISSVGAGNVNEALYQGILEALYRSVPVVISTRVPFGGVRPIYAYAGGGTALLKAGAIFANDLNPQKSRVLLMTGLGAGYDHQSLRELFA